MNKSRSNVDHSSLTLPQQIMMGNAIVESQAEDRVKAIPYRPQYNHITKRVTASILLQQISYWWYVNGREPFYKFKEPCGHEKYREGDSWCEELGISATAFDNALKRIAEKVTRGTNKTDLFKANLVIYWTDSDRVTWYQLNEDLFAYAAYLAYYKPGLLDKRWLNIYLGRRSKNGYIPSEITSEITSNPGPKPEQPQTSEPNPDPNPDPVTFDDFEGHPMSVKNAPDLASEDSPAVADPSAPSNDTERFWRVLATHVGVSYDKCGKGLQAKIRAASRQIIEGCGGDAAGATEALKQKAIEDAGWRKWIEAGSPFKLKNDVITFYQVMRESKDRQAGPPAISPGKAEKWREEWG